MGSECQMYVVEHVQRLKEVEDKVANYDKLIPLLAENVKEISANLKAVKWAAIGAAILFLLQQVGLLGVLKGLIL